MSRATSNATTPAHNVRIPLEEPVGSGYSAQRTAAAPDVSGTDNRFRGNSEILALSVDESDDEIEARRATALALRENEERRSRRMYNFDSGVEATPTQGNMAQKIPPSKSNSEALVTKKAIKKTPPNNSSIEDEKERLSGISKMRTASLDRKGDSLIDHSSNHKVLSTKARTAPVDHCTIEKRAEKVKIDELVGDLDVVGEDFSDDINRDGYEMNESFDNGNNANDGYSETASEITDTDSVAGGKKKKSLLKKMSLVGKFWDRSSSSFDSNKPKSSSVFKGFSGGSEKLTKASIKANIPFSASSAVVEEDPLESSSLNASAALSLRVTFSEDLYANDGQSGLTIDVSSPSPLKMDTGGSYNYSPEPTMLDSHASFPAILNTPAKAHAKESMSKEVLPIGLVDYFLLLGMY